MVDVGLDIGNGGFGAGNEADCGISGVGEVLSVFGMVGGVCGTSSKGVTGCVFDVGSVRCVG